METKSPRRPITTRKKPDKGSSLRWKGRFGRPAGRTSLFMTPFPTVTAPAIIPVNEATAAIKKFI